jgi:hypothetical protein
MHIQEYTNANKYADGYSSNASIYSDMAWRDRPARELFTFSRQCHNCAGSWLYDFDGKPSSLLGSYVEPYGATPLGLGNRSLCEDSRYECRTGVNTTDLDIGQWGWPVANKREQSLLGSEDVPNIYPNWRLNRYQTIGGAILNALSLSHAPRDAVVGVWTHVL